MNIKVRQCFVPYCGNNSFKTPNKVFISTPANSTKRQEWFMAASNAYSQPLRALTSSYCCEDHFNRITDFENWMEFKTVGTRLKLRSNVLPHIFKQKTDVKTEDIKPFLGLLRTKRKRDQSDQDSDVEESSGSEIINKTGTQTCNITVQANMKLENVEADTEPVNKISTDVNISIKNYESSTKKSTGSVQTVSSVSVNGKVCTNYEDEPHSSSGNNITNYYTIIEKYSCFNLGLSKDYYFLIKLLSDETNCPYVNVLITLKKIRLNDPFDNLTRDFSLADTFIRKIFIFTVPKMAKLLKRFIIWPDHSNTLLNLPLQYRTKFINVQSVIDFFEIQIEKPTTYINQSLTWSRLKKSYTMKYLISVNPDGVINFISPGYGGKTSEIEIIKNCGYLDVLPHNTTILGDKNLTEFATLLTLKNCKLITTITEQTAEGGKQITTLKRKIKSTICKLREFQILNWNYCIEKSCVHLLDFIVIISCGLVNLQEPADKIGE